MAPRKEGWKKDEDVALCLAWASIGGDGATGTNQSDKKLWERIGGVYEANKPQGAVVRTPTSCDSRWKKINAACQKWHQALLKAERLHGSGESFLDQNLNAKAIYYDDNKQKSFAYEHCWELLKDCPKFSATPTTDNSSFPNMSLDDDTTPPPLNSTNIGPSSSSVRARPPGRNAQKAGKKKLAEDESALLKTMERFADQADREYAERVAAEQRAENAHTMSVDASIYTPKKRSYWERKQQKVLDEEAQALAPTSSTPPANDGDYDPLNETEWIVSH